MWKVIKLQMQIRLQYNAHNKLNQVNGTTTVFLVFNLMHTFRERPWIMCCLSKFK